MPGSMLRRMVYGLLITLAVGSVVGRILAVDSIDVYALEKYLYSKDRPDWQKSRPFLSANDRSRWDTVRSLVEDNTYAIDNIVAQPAGTRSTWCSTGAATVRSISIRASRR